MYKQVKHKYIKLIVKFFLVLERVRKLDYWNKGTLIYEAIFIG